LVARLVVCPMRRTVWGEGAGVARSLISGTPVLIARDHSRKMVTLLRQLAGEARFDAIHADQLWMAPYALEAQAGAGPTRPRLVLDQHNAMYLIPQRLARAARSPLMRLAWGREARQMARYESAICQRFDHVVTVTDADAAALQQLYPAGQAPAFSVIPI